MPLALLQPRPMQALPLPCHCLHAVMGHSIYKALTGNLNKEPQNVSVEFEPSRPRSLEARSLEMCATRRELGAVVGAIGFWSLSIWGL